MEKNRPIRVMALGLRGMPNIPGGIETHASALYPRLAALGLDVEVIGRRSYRPAGVNGNWEGVSMTWLPSTRVQGVEAIIHTFLGIVYAAVRRPDVLHIHAVGPWAMTPLAKLLGLRVVVTHHGQDYFREKWNQPVRNVLRLGERLGMRYADEVIVISHSLQELAYSGYGRKDAILIPNGVGDVPLTQPLLLMQKYGLQSRRYIIQVSRLVPEKRQLDLIAAFREAALPDWKLLLVGGAQGSQSYANSVRDQIAGDARIVNTGFLSPPEVQELLSGAGLFALPSSHEGLPIALLEAMKLGTPIIASNISANREVGLNEQSYFRVGDTAQLAAKITALAAISEEQRVQISIELKGLCSRYDWDTIAESTLKVMKRAAHRTERIGWRRGGPLPPPRQIP
jgi:glycosyltransferase involved in cell wall biosynthesis